MTMNQTTIFHLSRSSLGLLCVGYFRGINQIPFPFIIFTFPFTSASPQAQAPIKLIPNAPAKTNKQAQTLLLPLKTVQLSSLKKSSLIKSTKLVNVNKPDEIAFMIPTMRRPTCEPGA
jgi:hypothetical protein